VTTETWPAPFVFVLGYLGHSLQVRQKRSGTFLGASSIGGEGDRTRRGFHLRRLRVTLSAANLARSAHRRGCSLRLFRTEGHLSRRVRVIAACGTERTGTTNSAIRARLAATPPPPSRLETRPAKAVVRAALGFGVRPRSRVRLTTRRSCRFVIAAKQPS
jgi:hypothetical protein